MKFLQENEQRLYDAALGWSEGDEEGKALLAKWSPDSANSTEAFLARNEIMDRYDYKVPYYNINGDMDYQTNYELSCEYFEQVNAPEKEMFVMKDATHGLLESRSEEFSELVHIIAEKQKSS